MRRAPVDNGIITPLKRKHSIIGAVYTYTRKLAGNPSMPIVTPRIDAEKVKQLIILMTTQPSALELKQLEKSLNYTNPFTVQGKRELETIKRKIELLKMNMTLVTPEQASEQIANLALMRGIRRIEPGTDFIYAETAPIIIETNANCCFNRRPHELPMEKELYGVYMGTYRIFINTRVRKFPDAIKVHRMLSDSVRDTSSYIHPHVSAETVCWGNFATVLQTSLQQGKLDFVISMMLQHLSTYNVDSPFRLLHEFHTGGHFDAKQLEHSTQPQMR